MLDSIVEQGSGKDFEKGLVGSSSAEGTLVKAGTPVPSHSAFGVPLTPAASSRTARQAAGTGTRGLGSLGKVWAGRN